MSTIATIEQARFLAIGKGHEQEAIGLLEKAATALYDAKQITTASLCISAIYRLRQELDNVAKGRTLICCNEEAIGHMDEVLKRIRKEVAMTN